jgi:hypothetical protein
MAKQNDDVRLGVPHRTNDEISKIAQDILTDFGYVNGCPVDVEAICEKHFHLSLIPIYQLKSYHGVDAYVTSDFRILVDQTYFEENSSRYRFSVAHELAHYIMHAEAYKKLQISDIESHLAVQNKFSASELKNIEQQAYRFAGCLLLPDSAFSPLVSKYFNDKILESMTIGQAIAAVEEIAAKFEVSKDVVQKQLMHFHRATYMKLTKILNY